MNTMKLNIKNKKPMDNRLSYLKCSALIATLLLVFVCGTDATAQTVITYTYDTQGRLMSENYENAYDLTFEYDEEGNMINKIVSDTLFMPGNKIDAKFVVYPNPAQRGFFINYAFEADNVPEKMTLHDSNGKIIKRIPVNGNDGVIHHKKSLAPGVYILKAGKLCSQKIVIL
jgi:YD repeat-containing protein